MNTFRFLTAVLTLMLLGPIVGLAQEKSATPAKSADGQSELIKVLIVDGQNNHGDWPKITVMLKQYLEQSGKFSVDVARTKYTWKGENHFKDFSLNDGKTYEALDKPKSDPDFSPDFAAYDVVVNNNGYNAVPWPDETKDAFESFIKNGGGMVSVHAADNSYPGWEAYNKMIGLGGWGGRNESSGPYVYYNESGDVVRDDSKGGGGGHGPQHEFSLVVRNADHPITKGLPSEFLHSKDELYERLRGPAENMTILATAFASPKMKGSGRHEPMLMVVDYGDGRIFHTTLGHADYSCQCVGFITTFLRGTEWAATGDVTIEIPKDYPTADKASSREFKLEEAKASAEK